MVLTVGCASRQPYPPPKSYFSMSGEMPGQGLSKMPYVTTAGEPFGFTGLSLAQRQLYEKDREKFERDLQRGPGNSTGGTQTAAQFMGECVVRGLIIFSPVCLALLPLLPAANKLSNANFERQAAAQIPYLPDLPSDQELSLVGAKISRQITAQGLAKRVLHTWGGQATGDSDFPRLVIRADSATFNAERLISIKVVVQAQPAAGVAWAPTEHSYHLGYGGIDKLDGGLDEAEASLAASIASMYGLGWRPISR
jgi:hypothetical protein